MQLLNALRNRFHPLHSLRKRSGFRWILRHFDPVVSWRVAGYSKPLYLRPFTHASHLLVAEAMEPGIRRTFSALITKDVRSFWDVGANIGIFTFAFADQHPEAEIISIEPDAKNLACLRKTARAWALPRHSIIESAAGDYDGEITFHLDEASGATGSVEPADSSFSQVQFQVTPRTIVVPSRTIDSLAAELNSRS